MLDLSRPASTDSATLEATARPWRDAGYRVAYRASYPHLTHQDLDRYATVLVLGGHPDPAAARLGAGDLVLLGALADRGGVVVLGYDPAASGRFNRWMMNRWLAWRGAGIAIGDSAQQGDGADTTLVSASPLEVRDGSVLRGVGAHPLSAGSHRVLTVSDQRRVLARAPHAGLPDPAAVLAASRLNRGLVVVVSRATLRPTGHGSRPGPARLLTELARWARRPAEWARIPPAAGTGSLALLDGPGPVELLPPLLEPPPGAATLDLPPP
jgi:hypothetical protein